MIVLGDIHFSRKLPHSRGDDRYLFRRELVRKLIANEEEIVLLGDVCDIPNMVDGRLFSDMADMFAGKRVYHVLGNHDRHSGDVEVSAGECLSKLLPDYECFTTTQYRQINGRQCVFAPYYSSESEIANAIIEAEKQGPTMVFGHWNFYSPIFGGKKFSKKFLQASEAFFCLGHIHTAVSFSGGVHLGVVSPVQFGEKQGMVLHLSADDMEMKPIEGGEEFHSFRYGEEPYTKPENTYAKVIYDGYQVLRKDVLDRYKALRGVYLVEETAYATVEQHSKTILQPTEEEIILSVAKERNFKNADLLIQRHRKIKEAS